MFTEPRLNTQPEIHRSGRNGEQLAYYVEKKSILDEKSVQSVTERDAGGQHSVIVVLTSEASQRFADFTRQNTGQQVEVFCNGWPIQSYIIAKPSTSSEIVLQGNMVPWLKNMMLSLPNLTLKP